jgi:hypothetical protein
VDFSSLKGRGGNSEPVMLFEFSGRWFVINTMHRPSFGAYVAIEWFGYIIIEQYTGQDCLGPIVELRQYKQRCCY